MQRVFLTFRLFGETKSFILTFKLIIFRPSGHYYTYIYYNIIPNDFDTAEEGRSFSLRRARARIILNFDHVRFKRFNTWIFFFVLYTFRIFGASKFRIALQYYVPWVYRANSYFWTINYRIVCRPDPARTTNYTCTYVSITGRSRISIVCSHILYYDAHQWKTAWAPKSTSCRYTCAYYVIMYRRIIDAQEPSHGCGRKINKNLRPTAKYKNI